MIESRVRVNFTHEAEGERAFEAILELLDTDDTYGSLELGGREVRLRDELSSCDLLLVEAERHSYRYDDAIAALNVPCDRLAGPDGSDRLEAVLSLVGHVSGATDVNYVFGMHEHRVGKIPDGNLPSPISDDGLARNRVDHPTWLMVFPPGMVEAYGRGWLENLPVDRVEALDDGAVMTVATTALYDCESDGEIRERVTDAMEPLEDAFETVED